MMRLFDQAVEKAVFSALLEFGVPHELAFEHAYGKSDSGLKEICELRELELEDYQYKELEELIKSI